MKFGRLTEAHQVMLTTQHDLHISSCGELDWVGLVGMNHLAHMACC